MLVPIKSWAFLAGTLGVVTAADTTRCYTFQGTYSHGHIPTTWYSTQHTPCTTTRTVTSTESTYLAGATVTTTVTSTSTISTATYTVPTPSGFLPIQSTYPFGRPYDGAYGKREAAAAAPHDLITGSDPSSFGNFSTHHRHKHAVGCIVWTGGRCTTETSTLTCTTSVWAPTAAPLTTVTQTASTTTTLSTTTVFAACLSANLGYVNQIQKVAGLADTVAFSAAQTPHECCVAAFGLAALGNDGNDNTALASIFGLAGAECSIVFSSNVCAGGQAANRYAAFAADTLYVVGNGPCGEVVAAS